MIVISVSGPCGSGKSTLIKMLDVEFEFLNSVYKNSKGATLDPTSYESKTDYANNWFSELFMQKEKGKTLLLSDRSPFDSLAYIKEKVEDFKNELSSKFKLLKENEIFHYSILVTATKTELLKRIDNRFNSGDRNETTYKQEVLLLDKSLLFFRQNIPFYDFVLDNTFEAPSETFEKIKKFIGEINNS